MSRIKRVLRTLAAPRRALCAAAPIALWLAVPPPELSMSDCDRLRRAIADASRVGPGRAIPGGGGAAARRRSIARCAYAQQIGCDNHKFLFFGSDPPAQCGQIHAQIGRMRANLEDLQARAGGGAGGRGELVARYNAECGQAQPGRRASCEALFGQPKPGDLEEQPLGPDDAGSRWRNPTERRSARRERAARRSACAPATARFSRSPIPRAAAAWIRSPTCAARSAPTPK